MIGARVIPIAAAAALLGAGLAGAAPPAPPPPLRDLARDAARAMDEERWADAAALYGRARELAPERAELPYNEGVARYRLGAYDEAARLFDDAMRLAVEDDLRTRSLYNLGNAALQQSAGAMAGAATGADGGAAPLDEARARLEEALDHFKQAIRAQPDDEDARANAELAHRLLRQLQQMQQQQEQQEQGDDGEPREDQQQSEGGQGEEGEQDGEQPPPPDQGEPPPPDQGGQPPPGQADPDQDQSQEQDQDQDQGEGEDRMPPDGAPGEPPPSDQGEQESEPPPGGPSSGEAPGGLTPEEAERLLQGVRDRERERREELARRRALRQRPVVKDW